MWGQNGGNQFYALGVEADVVCIQQTKLSEF